jgi:hypothetical protein
MDKRVVLGPYGGSGGTSFGEKVCPTGSYVSEINGRTGAWMDQVCAKCSDGTDLGCYGSDTHPGDTLKWASPLEGPFNELNIIHGPPFDNYVSGINQYKGFTGGGSTTSNLKCESAQKIVGITGSSGTFVDNLGVVCGYSSTSDYCKDNPNDPMCQVSLFDQLKELYENNKTLFILIVFVFVIFIAALMSGSSKGAAASTASAAST